MLRFKTDSAVRTEHIADSLYYGDRRFALSWAGDGWIATDITDPAIIESAAERVGVPIAALTIEEIPEKCPRCDSPKPHLHPAVQHGGECGVCPDPYHLQVTAQNTPERIARIHGAKL